MEMEILPQTKTPTIFYFSLITEICYTDPFRTQKKETSCRSKRMDGYGYAKNLLYEIL